ncbi:EI24 domain-containing protein [Sphingomonas silueang]|uniref:EI24 domain-containing protein n=1 Tax=Sphingomonas silueang TaxID=3156617 RepID=UPI0032B57EC6
MVESFFLSVAQLGDRAFLRVLAKSLAVTLALLVALGVALAWGANRIARDGFALGEGAGTLAAAAATLAAVALAWLLFRMVAIAVVGLFADEVVAAVEAKHYPAALAGGRDVPFARSAAMGLRSAGRTLAVNLLAAPLYLLLLPTGVGTPVAVLIVNGWLLGRDLFDMVAARHLPRTAMRSARRAVRARRFLLGVAGTGLLMIPFVNFVAPLIGAAMATHDFHRRRREGE